MKRLLFFVNPNAGHTEIRTSLMDVLQIFSQGGYEVTVHMTSGPRDLTRQILTRGSQFDLVVCCGGDGTLNEAVSGLMALPADRRPPLGYIPGGTVNDVASTLGLSKEPVAAAHGIVDGHPFPLDIGSFGGDRFFTYVAAFGIFTGIAYRTPQEDKRVLGRLAYFFNGVQELGGLKATHTRMHCDELDVEEDVLVGFVCSTTSVGGFKVPEHLGVSLNDGRSEIVLIRDIRNLADFSIVAACLLRADFSDSNYFTVCQTSSVRFAFDHPVAWTLDGEYGGDVESVFLQNNCRAVDIIVP